MSGLPIAAPVPSPLANAEVLASDGSPTRLATLWSERDALLLFVRHFACAGCSAHVSELAPRLPELDALGVAVSLVGSGTPAQLAAFVERNALDDLPLRTFTDPERVAYRAAGFERSVWGTIGPVAIYQLLRAIGDGHSNGAPEGDLYQQGGTLYVARGGELVSYDRARNLGEHAPIVDLVDLALQRRATEIGKT